jgi:hypothetical protein
LFHLGRPGAEAGAGAQGDGARFLQETTPPLSFRAGHGGQHDDPPAVERPLQARDIRRAQAHASQRGPEPPQLEDGAGGQLPGEHAAGRDPADARQTENGARRDGPERRSPGATGEDRDAVLAQAGVQEGPRRRIGPLCFFEQGDEQDLGRRLEGAHDGLTATKK